MTLEKIESNGSRFKLYFDEGELLVRGEVIADFGLYSGMELEKSEFKRLKAAAAYTETMATGAAMVSRRSLSKGELIEKLEAKGFSEENAEAAARWLEEIGAVNDSQYASRIVSHYSRLGYGKARIKNELYGHKVPRELWSQALEEIPDCDNAIDSFISSKLRGSTDKKDLKRVTDALFRRGFSWEEIRSGLRRYGEKIQED